MALVPFWLSADNIYLGPIYQNLFDYSEVPKIQNQLWVQNQLQVCFMMEPKVEINYKLHPSQL